MVEYATFEGPGVAPTEGCLWGAAEGHVSQERGRDQGAREGAVTQAGACAPHTRDHNHRLHLTVTSDVTDCPHVENGPKVSGICDIQGRKVDILKNKYEIEIL